MANILELSVEKEDALSVLGFNPKTKERKCFITTLTPKKARYILQKLNKNNRPINKIQVGKINENIKTVGFLWDGKPLTFNVDGNITEKQHFLTNLSTYSEDTEVQVAVVTGVEPDTFSNAAPDKPRTYVCEIQRKVGEHIATKTKIAALADLIKRSKHQGIKLNNGVRYWNDWSDEIHIAIDMTNQFWNNTSKFKSFSKTLHAWVVFCVRYKLIPECKIVLSLLESEIRQTKFTKLTSDALELWHTNASDLPNDKRMDFLFAILCTLTDRVSKYPNGDCEFPLRFDQLIDKKKLSGCFKTFTS